MSAVKRIQKEADSLRKKPCREFMAYPTESNPFVWMFTMRGPEETPYERGIYHGKLMLPTNYPYAPPDVLLLTPNGRFELGVKICLSEVTSYHPENWQPSWGVHTVLHALRGFMNTPGSNAVGAIEYPEERRRQLAEASRVWVSADGTDMSEHVALLDASPKWEDREAAPASPAFPAATPSPKADDDAAAAATTPPPAPVSPPADDAGLQATTSSASAAATEAAAPAPQEVPAAPATPVAPAPAPADAGPRMVDAVTAAPVAADTTWQVDEATLDRIVVLLLMGIMAILSKKYVFNYLDLEGGEL